MSLITPDFGLLVWMTLIFGIVFFVLAKWGFPMITGSVEKRAQRIGESIKAAKEAEERLRNLAEEQSRMIEEARQEQIAAEKESALRDVRKEVALLSVSVAEKVLKASLSDGAEQSALVDRLVDEVSSSKDLKN